MTRPERPSEHKLDLDEFDNSDIYERRAIIERLADKRADAAENLRILTTHLRAKSHSLDPDDTELYRMAVSKLTIGELTHPDLVTMAKIHGDPIVHADSFWRKIIERRRKKQLGPVPEKYLGIGKERDQLFAQILGVRMPQIHYTGPLDGIPRALKEDTLLKPTNSSDSRGAFYLFHEKNIYSIEHSNTLTSWDEMIANIVDSLGESHANAPTWQVQELVYEDDVHPARDIKFYCFYGRIGLILEALRHPTRQYAYFDERGHPVEVGRSHEPRFRDSTDTVVDKGGLTAEMLDYVRWLSGEIPSPFMRMDFLRTEDGLVFLEFSSAPGWSHTWSQEWDRRFGEYYLDAEMRLVEDLLAGKAYSGWRDFMDRQASGQTRIELPDPLPRRDSIPNPKRRMSHRILRAIAGE